MKAATTTATIAAIKAYSIALAPSSSLDHFLKNCFIFNIVCFLHCIKMPDHPPVLLGSEFCVWRHNFVRKV